MFALKCCCSPFHSLASYFLYLPIYILMQFQEFFTDDTIRMSRGVQQAIEMLRGNVWWQSHVYPDMDNWLRDNSQ